MASRLRNLPLAGICFALFASLVIAPAQANSSKLDKAGCLECHETKQKKIEVPAADDEKRTLKQVDTRKFGKGVHAELQCVACHTDIVDNQANHRKDPAGKRPDCISCHTDLWEAAKRDNLTGEKKALGVVVQNIEHYKQSFHARPDEDNPDKAKATCEECHASHDFNVPPKGSERRTAWHKEKIGRAHV